MLYFWTWTAIALWPVQVSQKHSSTTHWIFTAHYPSYHRLAWSICPSLAASPHSCLPEPSGHWMTSFTAIINKVNMWKVDLRTHCTDFYDLLCYSLLSSTDLQYPSSPHYLLKKKRSKKMVTFISVHFCISCLGAEEQVPHFLCQWFFLLLVVTVFQTEYQCVTLCRYKFGDWNVRQDLCQSAYS